MKRMNHFWYVTLRAVARIGLFFWHPVFRVSGREHVPAGPCVIAVNHAGMADPIWVMFALRQYVPPRILAKDSVLHIPVLGKFLEWVGLIAVRRGENDVGAIKTVLKALKDGDQLLIFPEGTRIRGGKRIEAKTGAMMFASRTGVPILPVWLEPKRRVFSPMRAVVGAPYIPTCDGKPTSEDLHRMTGELMDGIYALGETT